MEHSQGMPSSARGLIWMGLKGHLSLPWPSLLAAMLSRTGGWHSWHSWHRGCSPAAHGQERGAGAELLAWPCSPAAPLTRLLQCSPALAGARNALVSPWHCAPAAAHHPLGTLQSQGRRDPWAGRMPGGVSTGQCP